MGNRELHCSFCGKSQKEVKKLIAGPGVYICDECISIAYKILEEENKKDDTYDNFELPKPSDIKSFLDQYVIGQEKDKKNIISSSL